MESEACASGGGGGELGYEGEDRKMVTGGDIADDCGMVARE